MLLCRAPSAARMTFCKRAMLHYFICLTISKRQTLRSSPPRQRQPTVTTRKSDSEYLTTISMIYIIATSLYKLHAPTSLPTNEDIVFHKACLSESDNEHCVQLLPLPPNCSTEAPTNRALHPTITHEQSVPFQKYPSRVTHTSKHTRVYIETYSCTPRKQRCLALLCLA